MRASAAGSGGPTRAPRARAHFTPQHWLLCHLGLYRFDFEFELAAGAGAMLPEGADGRRSRLRTIEGQGLWRRRWIPYDSQGLMVEIHRAGRQSRGHEASSQSGLGVGSKLSSSRKLRGAGCTCAGARASIFHRSLLRGLPHVSLRRCASIAPGVYLEEDLLLAGCRPAVYQPLPLPLPLRRTL